MSTVSGVGRDLTGPGTPEQRWSDSGVLDALPATDPAAVRPAGRVVVVAPHPDDETLGVGGLLATWAADAGAAGAGVEVERALEVVVVAVTDGEASHPGSPTLTPAALAARRVDERTAALAALGLPGADVVRCRFPDGGVAGRVDELVEVLTGMLRPGDLCLAPVPGDGHPDHDATARAVDRAVAAPGVEGPDGVEGIARASYAIWLWHWVDPGQGVDPTASGFDGSRARRVELPPAAVAAKRAAVAEFTTQVAPLSDDPRDAAVLPPAVLARLLRDVEVLWWTT